MDAETLILETEESMLKAVDFAKQEFSGVRTGKASPGLVENLDVHVSSYGSVMKLKGLAVISTPEPRLILIQPFDPSTVHDIGRAINESKLNLNPLVEGRSIRLPIPALTEERRKDLVKLVKSQAGRSPRARTRRPQGRHGLRQKAQGGQHRHGRRPARSGNADPEAHGQVREGH